MKLSLNLLMIFSLLLAGCAGKLVRDPVIPAIDANYMAVEFSSQGLYSHGLGITYALDGNFPDIEIQGYNEGTIKVTSERCKVDATYNYTDNRRQRIEVENADGRSCLFTSVVSPIYSLSQAGDIKVFSFKGHFYVKNLKPEDRDIWSGYTARPRAGRDYSLVVKTKFDRPTVILRGCGLRYQKDYDAKGGKVTLKLHEIIPKWDKTKTCVVQGLLEERGQDELVTILISSFSPDYPDLPRAELEVDEDEVEVRASENISIISVNDRFKVDQEHKFKFNPEGDNILRLLTVKGRSLLAVWNKEKKRWEWIQ